MTVSLACHGCRSGARSASAHKCGRTDFGPTWGWTNERHPGSVVWVPGTLEASYARVSNQGTEHGWRLASADPISEYHRALRSAQCRRQPAYRR